MLYSQNWYEIAISKHLKTINFFRSVMLSFLFIHSIEKSIERGCLSDTTKCTNMLHCFICEGSGCNNLAGNNSNVPVAPNSATAWTSTLATVLVATLLNLKLSF